MSGDKGTGDSPISRRLPILIIGVIVAALLAWSEEIHQQVVRLIELAAPVIQTVPVLGAVLFVVLAALSAMLVFFSGLLLVPLGVEAWGRSSASSCSGPDGSWAAS